MEKTLNPLYGEEFSFLIPRDFRWLSFYVCDSDLFGLTGTRLGKVAIPRDQLVAGTVQEDQWNLIQPIHADSEVQGKLHLTLNVVERLVDTDTTLYVLVVRVVECCGLSAWGVSGLSDPYCQVMLLAPQGRIKSDVKRGQVRKKTVDPSFNESFEFLLDSFSDLSDTILRVSLWHQTLLGISEDVFLGQVNILLSSLTPARTHGGWYLLGPRPEIVEHPPKADLGSLRITVKYSENCIYPLRVYAPLQKLLRESLHTEPITDSALFILSVVHKERASLGRSLVKIFLKLGKLEELLQRLIHYEVRVTSDPNTLFRGNSLASKVIDEFMKLMGQSYLQRTLQCCIDEIFDGRRPCEIDPSRLTDGENLDINMANLLFFVEKILSAITASARSCPRVMCRVFSMLKEAAVRRFPEKDTVQYTAVSGFVFLRFFAPAILNPKLFNLRPESPSPVVARALTLISKTVQNMSNVGAKMSSNQTRKEDFMAPLNRQLMDHSHIKEIQDYLTAVSDPRGGEECMDDNVYREGMLIKRSQGRRKGPKNFRRRHFCLTDRNLTYSKSKGDSPLCVIPFLDLRAVERVDDNAFSMKFMFQLIQPERILYMQAKNSVDLMEWLSALAKACTKSNNQAEVYHSGAYLNGSWSCCGSLEEEVTTGCKPISLAVKLLGQREDIGLERELHKIYRMFLDGQTNLLRLKDEATSAARGQSEEGAAALPARVTTLCELLVFVKNLELSCSSQLTSRAGRLGTKAFPYSCSSGEAMVAR